MSSSEIPPFAPSPHASDAEERPRHAAPLEADPTAPADAGLAPVADPVADTPAEAAAGSAAEPDPAATTAAPADSGTDPSVELDPVAAHIADQLVALNTVGQLPLAEHAQLYQHLHAELQDALADIDGS